MLCCLSWLCSTWNSIRKWIGANKFLTVVHVVALVLLVFGATMVCWYWEWFVMGTEGRETGSTTARNLGLVAGGVIAIWVAIWRGVVADRQAEASKLQAQSSLEQAKAAQDQAETSQGGLLNERYQRGAEMLGSPVLAVRLGGIYALERLADDEPELYHVPIVRLFSAFARDPTKQGGHTIVLVDDGRQLDIKKSCEDVQEAVRAIGSRSATDIELEKKEAYIIGLIGVNLTMASLPGANLTAVFLSTANLTKASLVIANLTGADLTGADLTGADLGGATLRHTNLSGANLSKVKGLTQNQLDQAQADPNSPPKLDSAYDAKTGTPLKWRGQRRM